MSLAVLALCVAWTFWRVPENGSVLVDDPAYVFENGVVREGLTWSGVRWAFTTGHATNWHPLTWLAHMLDVEMWGLSPNGHHATSLALHALNAVLAACVFFRMTRAWWPSLGAALLFAVHPLRVESVAWIAERKDLLSVTFLCSTLLAWFAWVERPSALRFAWATVLYALGLMSKPMLVTLPCLLLLFDIWPLARATATPMRARLVEKLPFFVLAAASCVVTYAVQRAGGAMTSIERLPVGARVANALEACWRYLGMTVWPARLAVHYPHPERADGLAAVASFVALALVTWAALRVRSRAPHVLVGWSWFLITLVPVLGLVQVGQQSAADRYTLIPHLGLCLLVAAGLAHVAQSSVGRAAAIGGVASAAFALATATRAQVKHWQSSRTLFEHALAVAGESSFVLMNLGNAGIQAGELDQGIRALERALEIDPTNTQALNNLGGAYGLKGEPDRALACYRRSLAIDARQPEPHFNMGLALRQKGAHEDAIREFAAAFELDPSHYRALGRWAMELAARGDRAAAIPLAERAVELARAARYPEAAAILERELASWRASGAPAKTPAERAITR